MTLLLMILLGASQMYAQDSSYFFLDCPADVTVVSENPADGQFVDLPLAVAYGNNEPFTIVNDYNEGGADASDVYLVGSTVVTFTAFDSDSGVVSCSTEIYVIGVNDSTIPPIIVCPSDIYVFPNDSFGNTMWVDVPEVVATSPSGIASIVNSYNDNGANASDFYPLYETTTVVFTATDINGNSVTCLTSINTGADSTIVYGCMDPEALNYNPLATVDDGSCVYSEDSTDVIFGCIDPEALNYNPFATIDDGSCVYDNDSIPECTAIAAFQFTQIDPANNIVEISNTSVWEGDAIFFWDFGDGTTSSEPYPEHIYDENGVYLVCLTLTAQYGDAVCEDTYCDSIGLFGGNKVQGGFTLNVIPSILLGIEETSLFTQELNIYPNPASSTMNINYSLISNADVNVTIYDLSGRIVDFQLAYGLAGNNQESINVSELQPGMYILELTANKKDKIISRFIINR